MITLEEAWNKNWQHFIVENQPKSVTQSESSPENSFGGGKRCWYQHPTIVLNDGKTPAGCAIGILIPDMPDDVKTLWGSITSLFNLKPWVRNLFERSETDFWRRLQSSHDHTISRLQHARDLLRLAKDYQLVVEPLKLSAIELEELCK